MKRLIIRVEGSKRKPYKIQLQPGTTTRDVLAHLKLGEDYVLALASNPTHPFTKDADVHDLVTDGDRLIARHQSAPDSARISTEATAKYANTFMQ